VVDAVVGPPNDDAPVKFLDLMMLVSPGGRECTEDEWRALLAAADLDVTEPSGLGYNQPRRLKPR
jgi:hypothetical protein